MGSRGNTSDLWKAAADLISPDPYLREEGLDQLAAWPGLEDDPLAAYLLATRLADEDLEIRFHAVRMVGDLLDHEQGQGPVFSDPALRQVHYFLSRLGSDQALGLLEVAEHYLAAERPILLILRTCSYAGELLSGIVNDRKLAPPIRKLAVDLGAGVGCQELIPALENLVLRIEKSRLKAERGLRQDRSQAEDSLYRSAVLALEKLTAV